MSYSLSVKAASLAAAIVLANIEYDKIVEREPAHAHDRDTAFKNVDNVAAGVTFKENHDVNLYMNGSLSWDWNDSNPSKTFVGANVGCGIAQTPSVLGS